VAYKRSCDYQNQIIKYNNIVPSGYIMSNNILSVPGNIFSHLFVFLLVSFIVFYCFFTTTQMFITQLNE